MTFGKLIFAAIIIFLAVSASIRTDNTTIFYLSLIVNLFIAASVIFNLDFKTFKNLPILLIFLVFVVGVTLTSSGILRQLGEYKEGYKFDGFLFLNVANLIRDGQNYKDAYSTAFEEDIRFETAPTDAWGWRLPTIFYFWSFLPNDFLVWLTFVILALLALFSAFKMNFPGTGNLAILAPMILAPYFFFGATSEWFLVTEWWGLFFFIVGLLFWQIKKSKIAWILFLISVITRELFIVPILAYFLITVIFERKKAVFFGSLIIIFALFLLAHFLNLSDVVNLNLASVTAKRLWGGGWQQIQQTLAFGSANFLFINFRVFALYALLVLIGFGLIFWRINFKILKDLTFVSFASFFILYLVFGTPRWHEYWGITYIPLMFLLIPRILNFPISGKWE